jgi:Transposase DDE domain group 1
LPLACWLRPGTAHASLGATDVLQGVVKALRAAWPEVVVKLGADSGLAVPAVYDYGAAQGLGYASGYGSNAVLERAVAQATADVEPYYRAYGRREPFVQRYEEVPGYQAGTWPQARRVVAKVERSPPGGQRRLVVTNLPGPPQALDRDFYVQRGAVPERPLGALTNGLRADRRSACGFCANAWKLLLHVVAYAVVVLFREANAGVEEVACAEVGTLRQRLWKVPAVVVRVARRRRRRRSAGWPHRGLFGRVLGAVGDYVARLTGARPAWAPAPGRPL